MKSGRRSEIVEVDGRRFARTAGFAWLQSCVLVSDPEASEDQRFPMVCVIPLTGTRGEGALYPRIAAGASGLRRDSYALVDQVRAVDKRRVTRIFGPVDPPDLEAIDEGLRLFLGL